MDLALVSYTPSPSSEKLSAGTYRECLKNHAASIGGQAFDGCGEFMPAAATLNCAACGCHRNFHRRELSPPLIPSPAPVAFFPPPQAPFRNLLPPRRRDHGPIRKRRRTNFTKEQKERMRIFAEKLGWRIQKHDCDALERFCAQIGVKTHALKVWMHNHKNNFASVLAAGADPGRI